MKFDDFKDFTGTTAVYPGKGTGSNEELAYLALGLSGESGEVADCIKKVLRGGLSWGQEEAQKAEARNELGDVMWYWCRLAEALGAKPEDILFATYNKLQDRQRQGALKNHG